MKLLAKYIVHGKDALIPFCHNSYQLLLSRYQFTYLINNASSHTFSENASSFINKP